MATNRRERYVQEGRLEQAHLPLAQQQSSYHVEV